MWFPFQFETVSHSRLQHPQILGTLGYPGTNSAWIPRNACVPFPSTQIVPPARLELEQNCLMISFSDVWPHPHLNQLLPRVQF